VEREDRVTRTSFIAGAMLAALAGAGVAHAADLSVAPIYKAPPAVAPAYNWSGFYVGINGGGEWGRSRWDSTGGFGTAGGMLGGTAGYNWQTGPVVLGVEGDVDWQDLRGTTTNLCPAGCTTKSDWLSTVRGRFGYAFDRVMPYVTGGLAIGDIRALQPGFAGGSQAEAGWTAGGGVEFALTSNWTAKAEYLHVDLGNFNCGFNCGATPTNNVSSREEIVRAGVNYKFGPGN
jgi:outer membrane immunogenic protein